jgi:hypothetical protein
MSRDSTGERAPFTRFLILALGPFVFLACSSKDDSDEDARCRAAYDHAESCGLDTSRYACPAEGEGTAQESCGWDCYLPAECAEFEGVDTPLFQCLVLCTNKYPHERE